MKVITVCQPYAEWITTGEKWVENRTWATSYRGTLAIHAGRSRAWLRAQDRPADYVFGAIIGVAELVDCVLYSTAPRLLRAHAHAAGPWCLVLRDARRLRRPVPWKGKLMIRDLDAATRAAVEHELQRARVEDALAITKGGSSR
jgi:hypothetical protein